VFAFGVRVSVAVVCGVVVVVWVGFRLLTVLVKGSVVVEVNGSAAGKAGLLLSKPMIVRARNR